MSVSQSSVPYPFPSVEQPLVTDERGLDQACLIFAAPSVRPRDEEKQQPERTKNSSEGRTKKKSEAEDDDECAA